MSRTQPRLTQSRFRRVVRSFAAAALVGGAALTPAPARAYTHAHDGPWCVSTTDRRAQQLRQKLAYILSDTTGNGVGFRAAVGGLPRTDPSAVVLVDRENICRAASKALDRAVFTTPQHAPVYVVQAGAYLVVVPQGVSESFGGDAVYLDSAYQKIGVSLL